MYKIGLIGGLYTGAMLLAQLGASFPLIRLGCSIVLFGGFVYLGIDFLDDKSKAEMNGEYLSLLSLATEHIKWAVALMFAIILGVVVGW